MKAKQIFLLPLFLILAVIVFCSCVSSNTYPKITSPAVIDLLTEVQHKTFDYFYTGAHPVTKLVRERYPFRKSEDPNQNTYDECATGGTGMGLMVFIVGAERNFITREQAAERTLKILSFYENSLPEKNTEETKAWHGAFPHYINGETGKAWRFKPNTPQGADIVETAYFIQGVLTARQYYNKNNKVENKIRDLSNSLWKNVNWSAFLDKETFKLVWNSNDLNKKPNTVGYAQGFNETMITYILAMASPTHPIPVKAYYQGWAGPDLNKYLFKNSKGSFVEVYGLKQYLQYQGFTWYDEDLHHYNPWGRDLPIFWVQYSYLGLNPRFINDGLLPKGITYFDAFKNISLINKRYCEANPGGYKDYGPLWGLTASDQPQIAPPFPDGQYLAHSPYPPRDNGTITPTGSISSIVYTPEESIESMIFMYKHFKSKLWGKYGFKDAFNLKHNWFAESYICIDQGPIVIMIENYRTGLLWKLFMSSPEIKDALEKLKEHSRNNTTSHNIY